MGNFLVLGNTFLCRFHWDRIFGRMLLGSILWNTNEKIYLLIAITNLRCLKPSLHRGDVAQTLWLQAPSGSTSHPWSESKLPNVSQDDGSTLLALATSWPRRLPEIQSCRLPIFWVAPYLGTTQFACILHFRPFCQNLEIYEKRDKRTLWRTFVRGGILEVGSVVFSLYRYPKYASKKSSSSNFQI